MSRYDCPPRFESADEHDQWSKNRRSLLIANEAMKKHPPIKLPHSRESVPDLKFSFETKTEPS